LIVAFVRYSLIAAVTALGLYAMLIFATSLLFNGLKLSRQLDTGSLRSDAFFGTTGDVAAIYNRSALSIARPQVILVGASNFQKVLASEFDVPGFAAANISVDGSGLAEMERLVELAYESVSPVTRGRNVFVIGVWYGQFCNLHGTIMQSLNQQLTRYGLYRFGPDNSVVRTVPRSLLSPALTAIRPLLVEQRLWGSLEDAGKSVARFAVSGNAGPITVDQLAQNSATFDVAGRQKLIEERKATCTQIDPANFAMLDQIVDRITRNGDRAIIVDLPIPQWHADGVPMFAAYQRAKVQGFSSALSHEGAGYLDLQSSLGDDDFYDSVHPKPLAAIKLSHLIGAASIEGDNVRQSAQ
jgi:hypothetical protein